MCEWVCLKITWVVMWLNQQLMYAHLQSHICIYVSAFMCKHWCVLYAFHNNACVCVCFYAWGTIKGFNCSECCQIRQLKPSWATFHYTGSGKTVFGLKIKSQILLSVIGGILLWNQYCQTRSHFFVTNTAEFSANFMFTPTKSYLVKMRWIQME